MMHAAIYDAVNGITQTREPYLVWDKADDQASPEAAASVVARLGLLRLFPAQQAAFDATYNKVMRTVPPGEEKRASIDWGEHVAQALLADRAKDGSQAMVITFSSAGATVLAAFFGTDNIPFTTVSEEVPGVSRSDASFSEAAAEAGMSRIYGGIHFMSAKQQGIFSGAMLGAYVMEHFLEKTPAAQLVLVSSDR